MSAERHEYILITGGAGFIGRQVARHLTESGRSVRALDLLNPQIHRNPRRAIAEFAGDVRVGDVRDKAAVAEAMNGCGGVIHLAAETGVGQSMYETERYATVNVGGTRTVLDAAKQRDLPVIIASSRAVYGPGASECVEHGRRFGDLCCAAAVPSGSRESDPHRPVSVYGETKSEAERITRSYAREGLPVMILRPQNVIGAGQALHNPYTGVLAAFAARLRQGLPPQVYGSGEQTRDFISVDDVATSICWLLDNTHLWPDYPVLNLGAGIRVSLRELATTACVAMHAPTDLEFVDVTRPGDIDHACADLSLVRAAGLPAPRENFANSVQAFMEFAAREDAVDPAIWDRALDELSVVVGDE